MPVLHGRPQMVSSLAQAYWLEFLSLSPPFTEQATKYERYCPQRSSILFIRQCMVAVSFAHSRGGASIPDLYS